MSPGNRPDTRHEDEPTPDGEPLRMKDLNLPAPRGNSLWQRFIRGVSQFLAGMYIGEGCAGTPHSHRKRNSRPSGSDRL